MKLLVFCIFMSSITAFAENTSKYTMTVEQLTSEGALLVAQNAQKAARKLKKVVTVAIVGVHGETILIIKGDGVGPHNTEAARRKAYTSLSTGKSTLQLLRDAQANTDTLNLAELPELLLLSGGSPLWKNGVLIGGVGIAGGGSPENDDLIAKQSAVNSAGISTNK